MTRSRQIGGSRRALQMFEEGFSGGIIRHEQTKLVPPGRRFFTKFNSNIMLSRRSRALV